MPAGKIARFVFLFGGKRVELFEQAFERSRCVNLGAAEGKVEILPDRQAAKDIIVLRDVGDPMGCQPVSTKPCNVLALEGNFPGADRNKAGNSLDQCRFTCPVRTDDQGDLPGHCAHRYLAQDRQIGHVACRYRFRL